VCPGCSKERSSPARSSPKLTDVELLAVGEVVARIADAAADPLFRGLRAALAFDGDGTLWRGDVGEDFFHAAVELDRFLPPAVDAMRGVGRGVQLPGMDLGHDAGVAIARRLFQGYLDHIVPEDVICEVIGWVCAGWREADVVALSREVVVRGGGESRWHPEVAAVIEWARSAGFELFLVSASPRPVVEAAAAPLGFDRDHILAVTAPFVGGVMIPEVLRPIPYGPGKAALLAERLGGRPLAAAFGDNVFDVPMLAAARVPVLVEPKPRLVAHLAALEAAGAPLGGGGPPVRLHVAPTPPAVPPGGATGS